jgi:hypothetical protein
LHLHHSGQRKKQDERQQFHGFHFGRCVIVQDFQSRSIPIWFVPDPRFHKRGYEA